MSVPSPNLGITQSQLARKFDIGGVDEFRSFQLEGRFALRLREKF